MNPTSYHVIAICALILASISLIIGLTGLAVVVGLKNSTHSFQYIPTPEEDQKTDESMSNEMEGIEEENEEGDEKSKNNFEGLEYD